MKGFQLVRDLVVKHSTAGVADMKQSLALLNHMKRFGSVTTFKFMRDSLTKERTGMVFVSYQHYDDANKALASRRQVVEGLAPPHNMIEVSPRISKA
ncbi:hypothetical protein GQ54DRAFT_265942 [Martensiomyces pterosporus]|nr:hypothetical protein GQ54DRAFT_265942 [Martensiomyces pterosporus]